jgi:two-component system, NarL family, nitrate/nitrite response regulator NarL
MSGDSGRIRVLVADDHPLFRGGLVEVIKERPELELVGEAADGRQALDAIKRLEPDVTVLDVRMPDLEGMEVLHAVKGQDLETKVMFLSAFLDGEYAYRAVAEGARAYISKEADSASVCDAIVTVARGGMVFAPAVQSGLAGAIQVREKEHERPALSAREKEVLKLVAAGLSAPEIAEQMYLSPTTVKTHLQRLYQKLGVSERAAAVAEAMRRGLLD